MTSDARGEWQCVAGGGLVGGGVGSGLLPPVWKSHQASSMDMKNSYFSLNSNSSTLGHVTYETTYIGTRVGYSLACRHFKGSNLKVLSRL